MSGVDGSILYTFYGDSAGEWFGRSVSGAGDVNADGYADLIVGAALDDNNGQYSGSARVFSGVDGTVLYNFDGFSPSDPFLFSLTPPFSLSSPPFLLLLFPLSFSPPVHPDDEIERVGWSRGDLKFMFLLVGVRRFELPAPASRNQSLDVN